MKKISIVLLKQDLRISDNPAFARAIEANHDILPIYVYDKCNFNIGSSSKIWLHKSLENLNKNLDDKLNLYFNRPEEVILSLVKIYDVVNIFCNACYEPWYIESSASVKNLCIQNSINYEEFNGNYLWGPDIIKKDDGGYYKVFSQYKKKAHCLPYRTKVNYDKPKNIIKDISNQTKLLDLNLLPVNKWYDKIEKFWEIGESFAQEKLDFFLENHLIGYKENRNFPYKNSVSRLSPHLHFGEISPSQIFEKISQYSNAHHSNQHSNENNEDIEHFKSEILWREFSSYLLFHFKNLDKENFNAKFDKFPWKYDLDLLTKWQKGNTGYPLIDAGMRELWQTGYMHNRVRMVTASFLVKNLNIHWKYGMNWFWNCLVDADLANNSASWQWVAGSGADAAPYFRIFNPILQSEKFDSDGEYIKKFIPELKNMPIKYLHTPWLAPENILNTSGIIDYPKPIIDFLSSRNPALERYNNL